MSYGTSYPGSYSDNYGSRYSSSTRGHVSADKLDEQLSVHIKKALSPEEVAPKQKHVRAAIVYTWDMKGAGNVWRYLQAYPMLGDEVVIFKALVMAHKIMNQSHPNALREISNDPAWLRNLGRNVGSFRGSFDYEEYVTLKGVEDPNEGFETINDMLELLKKIDVMAKYIFDNIRPGIGGNECRISALIPLVEESYGIYRFLISMLSAMHQIVGSVDVLAPLREQFNQSHYQLYKFYYDCAGIKYLTSLITIPTLDKSPPDFLQRGPPRLPARPITPPPSKSDDDLIAKQQAELEAQIQAENQRLEAERKEAEARRKEAERLAAERREAEAERQRQLEAQRRAESQRLQELQQQQALYERQRRAEEESLQQAQLHQQRAMELQQYQIMLENMRNQAARDREAIDIYDKDELALWKQKYEALAKLYAQLRKEHLDLLNKYKEIKDGAGRQADDIRKELDDVKNEMKAKALQLTDVLVERDRLRLEADKIRQSTEEELNRLRKELKDAKDSLVDLSKSKSSEVSSIASRLNLEKAELEKRLNQVHEAEKAELERRLRNTLGMERSDIEEKLKQLLKSELEEKERMKMGWQDQQSGLAAELERLKAEHILQLNRMMDNILQTCVVKVDSAILALDDVATEGNTTASPEYVSTLLEKVVGLAGDFAASFIRMLEGADQAEAITTSNALAVGLEQLLSNTKGVLRLATDDKDLEEITAAAKAGAISGRNLFDKLKSAVLATIEPSRRPEHVGVLTRDAVMSLLNISPLVEKLAPKAAFEMVGGDIGDLVEKEMQAAAKAIEDAAKRLQDLMSLPSTDLNVHQAVLASAMALTNAIAQLIRCATVSQQEIVAHGRGSAGGSNAAFYKKNNKWTEGLVSAAKSVAVATTYLVECADGLVKGTHSMEQLIVAAQEVGVATTQLVAASRVKAIPFSKAQDKLEDAAVAVREATKLLVKAAKDAAKLRAEQAAREEIGQMGRHEIKIKEMEQQVKILELEKELNQARYKLGEIRKQGYME
ncbi:sla2 Src-like adaptor 2 [Cladochytrium tenue]|nr:sla2 Src-like adaptor 2 [Cladochytrium tenue]